LGKYILQLSKIPKLLKNVKEDSTVIKWCAAYALMEIVKNNPKQENNLYLCLKKYLKQTKIMAYKMFTKKC
jgi:hypothetical protein